MAMSRRLDREEEAAAKDIVAKCFQGGTRPLAPGIFEAQEILPNRTFAVGHIYCGKTVCFQ